MVGVNSGHLCCSREMLNVHLIGDVLMKKDISIDTLRGLACLLLVVYHVIGGDSGQGLRIPDGSYLSYLNESLLYLRMPLFTFLSGYVYALRPFEDDSFDFLIKKLRRLLIPMFAVATLFIGLQMIVPGTNKSYSFLSLYLGFPIAHFWFLESLVVIFLVLIPLEQSGALRSRVGYFLIFTGASLVSLLGFEPTLFLSINGAIYLAPYFLAGVAMHRFGLGQLGRSGRFTVFLLAILCIGITQLGLSGLVEMDLERRSLAGYAAGMTGVAALFLVRPRNKLLARIGVYSYTIYLFHVFATAGSRILFERLGVSGHELHLVLGTAAGIMTPIVLERLLVRYDLARLLLFGKRMHAGRPRWFIPAVDEVGR